MPRPGWFFRVLAGMVIAMARTGGTFVPTEARAAVHESAGHLRWAALSSFVPVSGSTIYLPAIVKNYISGYESPFGVVMYTSVNDQAGLPQMLSAGSRTVVTDVYWSVIEPTPPVSNVHTYNWGNLDGRALNAQAAGVSLYILVTGNPSWAAALPGGPVTDTAQLVNFVSSMAERYDGDGDANDAPGSPVINYWSFYAEPDNGDLAQARSGKGFWGNNPSGYAAMLTQIAPAIHAANPQAKVLIGGLAYDGFTTDPVGPGPFVRSFLTNTLSALNGYPGGVPSYLDAMAFHFYPISTWRWPTIREKALEIRGILDRNGASSLPLIVPEMGFWTDPANGSSEALQARTLVQMYTRGISVGIQQMSWFAVFDDGSGTESHGLFNQRDLLKPRQSYTAYATLAAELAGFHFDHAFAAPGIEGYVFRQSGNPELTVLWATTGPTAAAFSQTCARRVDLLGGVLQVVDGDANDADGAINGQVTLALAANVPVYVGACQ